MGAKILSMLVAVVSVPLMLTLLGTKQYGIWATLTSLVVFLSLLDLGVGNSIRNSVASMNDSNYEKVRSEFIGFFRLLCYVGIAVTICFFYAIPILNISPEQTLPAQLLYVPILLLLPLMLGASVLQGARCTGLQAVLQASGSWVFFSIVCLFVWVNYAPSIDQLSIVWSTCYVVALLLVFILALKKLQIPLKQLFGLSISALHGSRLRMGLEFLVLQLSALMLYSLGHILIFNHLGAIEVARYDVIQKIYQVGLGLYTVVIGVMWPEIARARAEGNDKSLRRIFRNLALLASVFSVAAVLGAFVAPTIIKLWTQERIQVETFEALAVAAVVAAQSLAFVGAVFMNAFEKVRLQIFLGVGSIVLMVPLTNHFLNSGIGITAVPLAAFVLTALPMITCNIYALHLIRDFKKAAALA